MDGNVEESRRWMTKARSSLAAASVLLGRALFAESVSSSYYAMFYAAKALLVSVGLDASKHSAVISVFGREYVKTGKVDPRYHRLLLAAFESRQKSSYDVYWLPDRSSAEMLREDAEEFLTCVDGLLMST